MYIHVYLFVYLYRLVTPSPAILTQCSGALNRIKVGASHMHSIGTTKREFLLL